MSWASATALAAGRKQPATRVVHNFIDHQKSGDSTGALAGADSNLTVTLADGTSAKRDSRPRRLTG